MSYGFSFVQIVMSTLIGLMALRASDQEIQRQRTKYGSKTANKALQTDGLLRRPPLSAALGANLI